MSHRSNDRRGEHTGETTSRFRADFLDEPNGSAAALGVERVWKVDRLQVASIHRCGRSRCHPARQAPQKSRHRVSQHRWLEASQSTNIKLVNVAQWVVDDHESGLNRT